jgi:hypothetical protein
MKLGDMKSGLVGGARPKLSILPRHGLIHGTRAIEFGADCYARGNYHNPPPEELGTADVAGAKRLLGYIDATARHLSKVADQINRALGTGGDLAEAASVVDDVAKKDFPASGLPDLSHAIASLLIGVTCAVDDGLLPADPGQPWAAELEAVTATTSEELAQKDDPAAERRRIADRRTSAPVPYSKSVSTPFLVGRRFSSWEEAYMFFFENSAAFAESGLSTSQIKAELAQRVSEPAKRKGGRS